MIEMRMTFAQMRERMDALAYLPGGERMNKLSWGIYYQTLGAYLPHELERAVLEYAREGGKWWPALSELVAIMARHRRALGDSWDVVEPRLQLEAQGENPMQLTPDSRVDYSKPLPGLNPGSIGALPGGVVDEEASA